MKASQTGNLEGVLIVQVETLLGSTQINFHLVKTEDHNSINNHKRNQTVILGPYHPLMGTHCQLLQEAIMKTSASLLIQTHSYNLLYIIEINSSK